MSKPEWVDIVGSKWGSHVDRMAYISEHDWINIYIAGEGAVAWSINKEMFEALVEYGKEVWNE